MKPPGEFVKSTIISGVLVILPLGIVAMLVVKIAGMLEALAAPIVEWLPHVFQTSPKHQ